MKKTVLFLLCIYSSLAFAQTFSGTTGTISDDGTINNYTTTVSGISAPLTTNYGLVQVCLDITHTWDSDLKVSLIAPNGTSINLFTGIGGADDDFTGTCLRQDGSAPINTVWAPFTGTFKPQETLGNLNNGGDGNGVWTLQILDTYAFADTGAVLGWSVTFGENAPAPFVFQSSNLPIVLINTNGVEIPDDPKIDALMGIIDNGEGVINYITDTPNAFNGNIGIELRGNYSQGLPQKPYKFETRDAGGAEDDVALLGMPQEHDWCLIANYNDKVFMRNTLSYSLFEQMGNYATRSRYCEVVLNGSYQGVYMLMESIKRDNSRVDIAKLEADENTGLNVTGGYILKSDYWTNEDSWVSDFHPLDHPDRDVRLVYEYPKPEDITDAQKAYIQNFIYDMESALYGDNFADPVNGYAKYMDVDSFIDYFIVNELARNIDGFRKSFFFNKDKDVSATQISKLKAGPVWDFDWAFKNIWSCSIFEATDGSGWAHHINDCEPDVASPGWHIRLLQDPAFANRLRCRYESYRESVMSNEALTAYIDDKAALLQEAQARHFEKWGNLGVNTGTPELEYDPSTFALQIDQFKNWINFRLAWLDANIPGTAQDCSLAVTDPNQNGFEIYPNPVKDKAYISISTGIQPDTAIVYDLTGKRVFSGSISNGSIDLSSVANGLYICTVLSEGSVIKTVKIAVAH
jgi:subtilisin-like proprotein convertase family protein